MSDLKSGKDYHTCDVHRSLHPSGGTRGYFAVCNGCGWCGHVHSTNGAACEDALAHDITQNNTPLGGHSR